VIPALFAFSSIALADPQILLALVGGAVNNNLRDAAALPSVVLPAAAKLVVSLLGSPPAPAATITLSVPPSLG